MIDIVVMTPPLAHPEGSKAVGSALTNAASGTNASFTVSVYEKNGDKKRVGGDKVSADLHLDASTVPMPGYQYNETTFAPVDLDVTKGATHVVWAVPMTHASHSGAQGQTFRRGQAH